MLGQPLADVGVVVSGVVVEDQMDPQSFRLRNLSTLLRRNETPAFTNIGHCRRPVWAASALLLRTSERHMQKRRTRGCRGDKGGAGRLAGGEWADRRGRHIRAPGSCHRRVAVPLVCGTSGTEQRLLRYQAK